MPSTLRLDHSISGPALDALRAGSTEPRIPQWRAGQGVNAYAPTAPRPASPVQLGSIAVALVAVVAVVALGIVAVRVLPFAASFVFPAAPPVVGQPQLAAPTAAVVVREVVVVVTATPAPAPVAVQPVSPAIPVARAQPQSPPVYAPPVYVPPAPPVRQAPARQQTYVAPQPQPRQVAAASVSSGSGGWNPDARPETVTYSVNGGRLEVGKTLRCYEGVVTATQADYDSARVLYSEGTVYVRVGAGAAQKYTICRAQ